MRMRPAAASRSVLLLVLAASPVNVAAQDPPAQRPPQDASLVSACPVADDPEYGFTRDKPVQVGGGPMYFTARQRRVLDVLRGPDGQPVRYKRVGATSPAEGTILDIFELTYDGLKKPATVYMDGYHFNEPSAPQGFACAAPIKLAPPGPDPFRTSQSLVRVAVEQGGVRSFTPIPLGADGTTAHGVAFDWFRRIALAARAAATSGKRLDPEALPRDLLRIGMVVVAYPLRCDGRIIAPSAIAIVDSRGREVPREGGVVKGDAAETLLPGVSVPEASLAAVFEVERPRPIDSARITYADTCSPTSNQITLPFKMTAARLVDSPAPPLPDGAPTPTGPVFLQILIDTDGAAQQGEYIGGPTGLTKAAIDAVKQWRFEPPSINGAPLVEGVTLQVRFTQR